MKIVKLRYELQDIIEESLQGAGIEPSGRHAILAHAELDELELYGFTYRYTSEVKQLVHIVDSLEYDMKKAEAEYGDATMTVKLSMPYAACHVTLDEYDALYKTYMGIMVRTFKETFKQN